MDETTHPSPTATPALLITIIESQDSSEWVPSSPVAPAPNVAELR